MSDERWSKILKRFALISAVIALVEGLIYFDSVEIGVWPYFVNTVQNAVHTFLFDADISAADAHAFANSGIPLFERCISYLYMLVVLAAPICSTCAVYSAVEIMLHRKLNPFVAWGREPVLILGEHESLTAAIINEESSKYHFYLATKDVVHDDGEELDILRKQTVIIHLDDYEDYDNNIEILSASIRLKKLKRIVVACNTMAENLTLYMWICNLANKGSLSKDVKVYALCNGFGGERILEQIYENDLKKDGMPDLITYDSDEISARKILTDHMPSSKDGNVHAVFTGCTPLVQQLTANLMNMAVVSAEGSVTIDIIDADVEDSQKVFARRFSSDYFEMDDKCWKLTGEKADGKLVIRFHEADPKERFYKELLEKLYQEEHFTYAAICLPNADDALAAMLELEQIIRTNDGDAQIPIGIRIDENTMLAENLASNRHNIFTFDEKSGNITMDDIFYEKIDTKAKIFNYIYGSIRLVDKTDTVEACETIDASGTTEKMEAAWKRMLAFQRTSSRMLADHAPVKETVADLSVLKKTIGTEGTVMMRRNNSWVMLGDDADFLHRLEREPAMEELVKMEHRRWCYAMAACGWSYAPGKKDPVRKTNPCLVSWEKLKQTHPDMCKYDVMPYMYCMLRTEQTKQ